MKELLKRKSESSERKIVEEFVIFLSFKVFLQTWLQTYLLIIYCNIVYSLCIIQSIKCNQFVFTISFSSFLYSYFGWQRNVNTHFLLQNMTNNEGQFLLNEVSRNWKNEKKNMCILCVVASGNKSFTLGWTKCRPISSLMC